MTKSKPKKKDHLRKSKGATNPERDIPKGQLKQGMRDNTTIRRLNMYKTRPTRDKKGKILSNSFNSSELNTNTRIQPDRRWFGNTRVVGQEQLERFRNEISTAIRDPYTFVLRRNTLPLSLLSDPKPTRMKILGTESFADTFGPKKVRKKPNLQISDIQSLAMTASQSSDNYSQENDRNVQEEPEFADAARAPIFSKGQSKRIWAELYKVVDSSDVIIQVLDARDPMGTRSYHIEKHIETERSHKQLIFLLNKCDLIPTWATARWVRVLSAIRPTLAFHASLTNPFGKGSLIQLLRQFGHIHRDKPHISVGFIGYPNVGKSSIINTLRAKKVCKVAPIPGETKVWQYVTLFKRIFLIDCPGVVYSSDDTETDIVLKGVVRVENVEDATEYIPGVLGRVKKDYLRKTYNIDDWEDPTDFLTQFAKKYGRLLKGGEPDLNTCAKMVLNDWQRGKIPFFVPPPFEDDSNLTLTQNLAPTSKQDQKKKTETKLFELRPVLQDFQSIRISESHFDEEDLRDPHEEKDEELSFVNYDQVVRDTDGTTLNGSSDADIESDDNGRMGDNHREEKKKDEGKQARKRKTLGEEQKQKSKKRKVQGATQEGKKDRVTSRKISKKQISDESDQEDNTIEKQKRMTTNKSKIGVHFYEFSNVKNRNRNRKKPKKSH